MIAFGMRPRSETSWPFSRAHALIAEKSLREEEEERRLEGVRLETLVPASM